MEKGCPFNKFKECKKEKCKFYFSVTIQNPNERPQTIHDCVFIHQFNATVHLLSETVVRLSGTQKAAEQTRNIMLEAAKRSLICKKS